MAEKAVKPAQIQTNPNHRYREDKMVRMGNGEMGRYIRHALWNYYAEPIDISDPKQVEKRIGEYFKHCIDDDMKPTVSGICNALGITRATFHNWCEGTYRKGSHLDAIKKAKGFLEEMMENYMVSGKINPVTGIFLMKNNFGYRDQQEVVLKPSMELGDETSPEELQKKYLEATGQVVDSTAEPVD